MMREGRIIDVGNQYGLKDAGTMKAEGGLPKHERKVPSPWGRLLSVSRGENLRTYKTPNQEKFEYGPKWVKRKQKRCREV